MRWNHIVIPAIAITILTLGGYFSRTNMNWYATLAKPALTPPRWAFPIAWNIIYILTTIAALVIYNKFERTNRFWLIITLLIMNAFLNCLWSYLFFRNHLIGWALVDAILLTVNTYALIITIWPISSIIASLLIPYALWSSFAIILNYQLWHLNG